MSHARRYHIHPRYRHRRTPGDHLVALVIWTGAGLLLWLVALWFVARALGWR